MCATVVIFEVSILNKQISGGKLEQPLNMAQEISWSVLSRTTGIFGSFVWSINESILEQL